MPKKIKDGGYAINLDEYVDVGTTLIYYGSLLSPYDFEKNNNLIVSYFKKEWMQL